MATLKDVAKLANVDPSTVSRALNNTSYVHPQTKKRILEAVEALSYQPNLIAKGLKKGKNKTIGILVPTISISVFGELVLSMEMKARELGYSIIICNTKDDPKTEEECLIKLRNGLVDGIIIASTGQNIRLLRDLQAGGLSIIQLIRKQDKYFSSIIADYYESAYDGVKCLYQKGCRRIGFVNGRQALMPYEERERGYRKAMCELKLTPLIAQLERHDFGFHDGYMGFSHLYEKYPDLDGVLTALDLQGMGVLRACKERNIAIPRQMKVLSLTGNSIGTMLETAMSSIEIPVLEIAVKAIEMMVEILHAKKGSPPSIQHLVFSPKLVERETT